jgi:hypothetical protein
MKPRAFVILAASAMLASPIAYAQTPPPAPNSGSTQQGTTSGPAAGTNVEPSTVTHNKQGRRGKGTAAGAPGTPAKPGSEGGAPPK